MPRAFFHADWYNFPKGKTRSVKPAVVFFYAVASKHGVLDKSSNDSCERTL